jgi:23S rRNA (adenine2030-N6)-methyltransferase
MLWYPIKGREAPDALARRLAKSGMAGLLRCEISIGPPREDVGLTGSGLVVVNPPFQLDAELRRLMPKLARWLAPEATSRIDWLAARR